MIISLQIIFANNERAIIKSEIISVAEVSAPLHKTPKDSIKQERTISAILALPLPTGIIGGHRIYLGTKPFVPVVYIATFGGCFGILPFIDFVTILMADPEKLKSFENNPHLFMWIERKK